jgi:beta-alanine--pyruvate transaminase
MGSMPADVAAPRNSLNSYWMPFTANRRFKGNPLLLAEAEGMHYRSESGRSILDGTAGLWCVNAGHGRPQIAEAVQQMLRRLDYAPSFQISHPSVFQLADRLAALLPGFEQIFFTNSGSESVDTALKIAIAYHRARGEAGRIRLIGRERGYHGVGFGGTSVGGIPGNRKAFGPMLGSVDHLPHTHNLAANAYSRGEPEWGAHLADDLERLVALHDASTIAAVIVEPVAGSTGVLVPPKGYLRKLREICSKHGILLIFDEVITAFGRLGSASASTFFDVNPDLITMAKGLTNGAIPMGAVAVTGEIYGAFMRGDESAIELAHGYTYSGHPVAVAAAIATLNIYQDEQLFERAAGLAGFWADALHSLRGRRHVIDIRNLGLMGAIEVEPRQGKQGARAFDVFERCFEKGVLVRVTGDVIALSPPLIVEKKQIDQICGVLAEVLASTN